MSIIILNKLHTHKLLTWMRLQIVAYTFLRPITNVKYGHLVYHTLIHKKKQLQSKTADSFAPLMNK